ncbi:MAG: hypothetical protein WKF41_06950 [Gaiellaceae bacterium]
MTERSLECLEAAEGEELRHVGFAAEGGEHSCEVGGRRDRGAEALADRFSGRCAAEVVVAAARAGRLGDDLELARRAVQSSGVSLPA